MAILFQNSRIRVLRHIWPKKRIFLKEKEVVPNDWIAKNGMFIGNDLDNCDGKHHVGNIIPKGKWPVYLLSGVDDLAYFLHKNDWLNLAGSVVYLATLNLFRIKIGLNAAFLSDKHKKQYSLLSLKKIGTGYSLFAEDNLGVLDKKLVSRLDENGALLNMKGEFYLDSEVDLSAIADERIFKTNGQLFDEITSQIKNLRKFE